MRFAAILKHKQKGRLNLSTQADSTPQPRAAPRAALASCEGGGGCRRLRWARVAALSGSRARTTSARSVPHRSTAWRQRQDVNIATGLTAENEIRREGGEGGRGSLGLGQRVHARAGGIKAAASFC